MTEHAHVLPPAIGTTVVALAGELDLSTVEALCARAAHAIGQPGTQTVSFDMAAVTFMDSSTIGALVDIRDTAERRGITIELVNVARNVLRVLEITGVADHLGARPDA